MNDSVNELITKKIDNIVKNKNIYYSGQVIRINNFIIEARGLDDAFYFEKVFINNENNIGYVEKIESNKVVISLIKTDGNVLIGDTVMTTGEILETNFSEDSVGMIIDPFGVDRITGKKLNNSFSIPVETPKIGIMERTAVNRPLETGIAAIDLMFPIGRGQRQLIIGDKKTGKTQICLDTIANQKDKNVMCIYVAIGKNKKELKNLYAKLVQKNAHTYTIIVSAFNDDLPPLIKLTPYIALSIAEYYMKQGKDVLVCIDDLKKHAEACREIALLSEKNTGRDAYPADIFYTHSRLLEKGCQHQNGGSITILPIVETKGSDITDYISTNIISITDGQIVLSDKMFKKGQKPAINFGLSVSRLGSNVQNELIKKIGAAVRRELLTYLETADVYQLVNIESMSPELQEQLLRGNKILELLKQPKFSPFPAEELKERFAFINEKKVENTSENNDKSVDKNDDSNNDNITKSEDASLTDKENLPDNNEKSDEDVEESSNDDVKPLEVEQQNNDESPIEEEIPLKKLEIDPLEVELPVDNDDTSPNEVELSNEDEDETTFEDKVPLKKLEIDPLELELPVDNDEESSSNTTELPAVNMDETNREEVPINNIEITPYEVETPVDNDEESSSNTTELPIVNMDETNTEEVPINNIEITPYEVVTPVDNDEESSADTTELPVVNMEETNREEAPINNIEITPYEVETPVDNEESSADTTELPVVNMEETKREEVPINNIEITPYEVETPVDNEESASDTTELPVVNMEETNTEEVPINNIEITPYEVEMPTNNAENTLNEPIIPPINVTDIPNEDTFDNNGIIPEKSKEIANGDNDETIELLDIFSSEE